jgi:hypothetical protein
VITVKEISDWPELFGEASPARMKCKSRQDGNPNCSSAGHRAQARRLRRPLACNAPFNLSKLAVWWLRLGIALQHGGLREKRAGQVLAAVAVGDSWTRQDKRCGVRTFARR